MIFPVVHQPESPYAEFAVTDGNTNVTWQEAVDACKAKGMRLLEEKSQAKTAFL